MLQASLLHLVDPLSRRSHMVGAGFLYFFVMVRALFVRILNEAPTGIKQIDV